MGIHPPVRSPRQRTAALLLGGALSFSLLAATPAVAETITAESAPPADSEGVTPESPTAATENVIRIGNLQTARPDWITSEQAQQLNAAATDARSVLAHTLEATGLSAERADLIAAAILTDATVGAAIGAAAAAPIAVTGALVGAVSGVVAGIPFAPVGLVVVPAAGAALGYAMVAAPFAAIGAAVGAAAGAAEGYLAAPVTG